VAPLSDRRASLCARLEDNERLAVADKVRGGRQAYGACADHCYGNEFDADKKHLQPYIFALENVLGVC
jgi:hypothetical protein